MDQQLHGSGTSVSSWMGTSTVPEGEMLTEDIDTDVCIVGAGMAGLTAAYLLAKEGKTVAVLDMQGIAAGETARTTAHLSNVIDDRFTKLIKIRGEEHAQRAQEAHAAAISRIESIVADEKIACDFLRLPGLLFAAEGTTIDDLQKELDAARRAGLADVSFVEASALPEFQTGPHLAFPHQAAFHPLLYLTGLAESIRALRGRIYAPVRAGQPEQKDGRWNVATHQGPVVRAEHVILATNMPVNADATIYAKLKSYRTYAVAAHVPAKAVPEALIWDTASPYHYVRLQRGKEEGGDMVIVGGEDHLTGQAEDTAERWDRLEAWARERFPAMGEIAYRWSGQWQETPDGLAMIGRVPGGGEGLWCVTGDSGMGMTHGMIAGMLLTDVIAGRENAWAELFDPARIPPKAAGELAGRAANAAKEYITGYLGPGEVSSEDEIRPGSGGVLREGVKKIALYRGHDGTIHRRSAVCPHRGCIVQWNGAEDSWDCPCHGSRFAKDGSVITAPAHYDLDEA